MMVICSLLLVRDTHYSSVGIDVFRTIIGHAQQGGNLFQPQRLDQVMVESGLMGQVTVALLAPTGLGNDLGMGKVLLRAEAAADLVAVEIGKADVQQDNIRAQCLGL